MSERSVSWRVWQGFLDSKITLDWFKIGLNLVKKITLLSIAEETLKEKGEIRLKKDVIANTFSKFF